MEDTRSLFQRMQWQHLLKLRIPCCCKICRKASTELKYQQYLTLKHPDLALAYLQC